jgi:hypothetical protein
MRKSRELRRFLVYFEHQTNQQDFYAFKAVVFATSRIVFGVSSIVSIMIIYGANSMSVPKSSSFSHSFPHGGKNNNNRHNHAGFNRFGLRPPQQIPQRPLVELGKGRGREGGTDRLKNPTITYYSDDIQQEGLVVLSTPADTQQTISSRCACGAFHIEFAASNVAQSPADTNFFSTSKTTSRDSSASSSPEYFTNDSSLIQRCRRTAAVDCHCAACRKYHVAAFASYIQVSKDDIKFVGEHTYNALAYYKDYCSSGWGIPCSSNTRIPVNRVYCKYCSSKMYTEPLYTPKWMQNTDRFDNSSPIVLLNMGPIEDDTIPYNLEQQWKHQGPSSFVNQESYKSAPSLFSSSMEERQLDAQTGRIQWKESETAPWTWSVPKYGADLPLSYQNHNTQQAPLQGYYATDAIDEYENDYYNSTWHRMSTKNSAVFGSNEEEESDIEIEIKGGCTCGSCQYQIQFQTPSELQHCYCRLCRQLSGSAFMTWIPIPILDFKWTHLPLPSSPTMDENHGYTENFKDISVEITSNNHADQILQRYTDHARRHVCPTCRSVMTISYDDDYDNAIWIAAGTMDNIYLPSTYDAMSRYLDRVVHICCMAQQSWYELPDDGMMRIDNAS